jgi:hypothetical protein
MSNLLNDLTTGINNLVDKMISVMNFWGDKNKSKENPAPEKAPSQASTTEQPKVSSQPGQTDSNEISKPDANQASIVIPPPPPPPGAEFKSTRETEIPKLPSTPEEKSAALESMQKQAAQSLGMERVNTPSPKSPETPSIPKTTPQASTPNPPKLPQEPKPVVVQVAQASTERFNDWPESHQNAPTQVQTIIEKSENTPQFTLASWSDVQKNRREETQAKSSRIEARQVTNDSSSQIVQELRRIASLIEQGITSASSSKRPVQTLRTQFASLADGTI